MTERGFKTKKRNCPFIGMHSDIQPTVSQEDDIEAIFKV